jgi:hypothetical protein
MGEGCMPTIRRGVTRTVILTRHHAIKVPTLRGVYPHGPRGILAGIARGLLANQSEYTWYSYESWSGKVAPVLHSWLGGFVQVYPRCQELPDEALLPVLDPCPGDIKPDNFGLLNGRIVRIDYDMS